MQMPPTKYDMFQLAGGLDQVTPTLMLPPGVARRAVNFECSITGGYTRIQGYERFDGHARPSDAYYLVLSCTITGTISVGNTVTGMTLGGTGKVIARSGSDVVITRQTGSFQAGEGLSVAGQQATIVSLSGAVADGLTDATYKNMAADEYRASISAVPGSGSILGLCYYADKLYAFRNNVGGTAADMYVQSAAGWVQVTFGEEISFTNANTSVGEGDTLTQGGVTATIARLVVETGTLLSGTNTGRMVLTGRSGGNFAAGAATSTGGGALTLSAAQSAITLPAGGKYRFEVANFGASAANRSMYGVNGVGRAFEFDGVNLVPISTGMVDDTPDHIAVHNQHLFLAFGYSLQFSGIGNPFAWTPVVGAGEIGMLDDITNLKVLPGDQNSGALLVTSKNQISILYGSSSADFALTSFNSGAGARTDTVQKLEQAYMLNDFGVTSLAQAQDFGNFAASTLTQNIRPYVTARTPLVVASGVQREKGQYRLFFSDGTALYSTIKNGQYVGSMPIEFYNIVTAMCEGEDSIGNTTSYFGSTNGMVYEMDVGTSFDGEPINATVQFVFNSMKSPRTLKRYRKASIEVTGGSYIAFDAGYDLGYKSTEIAQALNQSYAQYLRASYWDSFTWDNFVWDGSEIEPAEIYLDGTAENISFRFSSLTDLIEPFTINTITTHFTPQRGIR